MNRDLVLPENLRNKLKEPLGKIISDLDGLNINSKTIICVGDIASEVILKKGIKPKLCIYDNMSARKKIKTPAAIEKFKVEKISVKNPPGHLTSEVFAKLKEALSSCSSKKIFVNGEEDLTTLAAIDLAPIGSLVFYGQPDKGMVMVNVDKNIKDIVKNILNEMRDYGN